MPRYESYTESKISARAGYDTLGLSTFLTAGEKEVRAWQIHKGYTAPQAQGQIYRDSSAPIFLDNLSFDSKIPKSFLPHHKKAGTIRTASIFSYIQLSNSRVH